MIILIFTWWRGEEGLANLMAGSLVHPLSMITSAIARGVEISLLLEPLMRLSPGHRTHAEFVCEKVVENLE